MKAPTATERLKVRKRYAAAMTRVDAALISMGRASYRVNPHRIHECVTDECSCVLNEYANFM